MYFVRFQVNLTSISVIRQFFPTLITSVLAHILALAVNMFANRKIHKKLAKNNRFYSLLIGFSVHLNLFDRGKHYGNKAMINIFLSQNGQFIGYFSSLKKEAKCSIS